MLSVMKLLGRPQFKVKSSFLGVFELKMLHFFVFRNVSNFLLHQSKIEAD